MALQEWLLCRTGTRLCAVPLSYVAETMRILPIRPISGAPHFVSGVAIIRGSPVPVVDTASLLDENGFPSQRLVTLDLDDRQVALAVGDVLAVRSIAQHASDALPPLLQAASNDAVQAIRILDNELLIFLEVSRLLTDSVLNDVVAPGLVS